MRYKETIKRGISLLLVLVLAVSLIVPAAAVDGGRGGWRPRRGDGRRI